MDIGSDRELFVDEYLIDKLDGAHMVLHHPRHEGPVMKFDKPWEGIFCGYCTVLKDGDTYRAYYRGMPKTGDGGGHEVTCMAESKDGCTWTKPELGIYEINGTLKNNVIYAKDPPNSHNFHPFIDTRKDVPKNERYKATSGVKAKLYGFVSPDGIHWRKVKPEPILTCSPFDSANVAFWSDSEQCYICYFRVFIKGVRWIARATSKDFLNWGPLEPIKAMHKGKPAPIEHIYTNQTFPYFRAPQIYTAPAARFMPGRQVISDAEAKKLGVHPRYFRDISDSVLMTSRGGNIFDRTFMEGFIRNDIGLGNWISRTNYPAWQIVQTGPSEMSFYANCNYAQPTAELRRFSMRLDGFASIQAGYDGGRVLTKLLKFKGKQLVLNFATSAAGSVRVEIQDDQGNPIPGFTLADSDQTIGNEIERAVSWKGKTDVSSLAGRPVRLLFELKDADVFAFQFK
ncbi:MAG: hypothetical protein JXM70_00010 [Pirellulales bacterium]|nr:hypothetical protein [Pirellulales bacterium]